MSKKQRVGLHVSAAGGLQNAPDNASEFNAEVFQFFSRSPRGGAASEITDEIASEFKERVKNHGILETTIHTPYYINFASKKKGLAAAASRIIREELTRGSTLGVDWVVTHLGSAKDWEGATTEETPKEALEQVVKNLKDVFKGTDEFSSKLLLEISAGAGSVIGDTFEELAFLLDGLGRDDVHVCLDTCHMFASGYDMRDETSLDETMKQFRKQVGVSDLKLVHVNDSKADLNEHKDRHEHIGKGKIGSKGFKAMLAHKDFQKVNFILETKHDAGINADLKFLRTNRKVK